MDEYGLGKSAVGRRIKSINATGSLRAADNRTPEKNRIQELGRENRRLRMEVDVLLHALAARPDLPRQKLGPHAGDGEA